MLYIKSKQPNMLNPEWLRSRASEALSTARDASNMAHLSITWADTQPRSSHTLQLMIKHEQVMYRVHQT